MCWRELFTGEVAGEAGSDGRGSMQHSLVFGMDITGAGFIRFHMCAMLSSFSPMTCMHRILYNSSRQGGVPKPNDTGVRCVVGGEVPCSRKGASRTGGPKAEGVAAFL